MELSAEMFNEVVKLLRSDASGGKDLRKAPRVGLRAATTVRIIPPDGSAQSAAVHIRDISSSGLGMVHSDRIPKGTRLVLHLRTQDDTEVAIEYIVRRCMMAATRSYLIGAELVKAGGVERKSAVAQEAR